MDFGEYDEKVNQLNDVTKDYMEKAQAKKDEAIEKLKGLGETYETIAGGILGGSTIFNEVTGGNHGLYTLTKKIGGDIMDKGVKQTAQDLFQNTKTSVQNFLGRNPALKGMNDLDLQSKHQLATKNLKRAQEIANNEELPDETRAIAQNASEKLEPIQKNLTNELENRNIVPMEDRGQPAQPAQEDDDDADADDDAGAGADADEGAQAGVRAGAGGVEAEAEGLTGGLADMGLGETVGAGLDATGILAPIGLAIQVGTVLGTAIEGLEDLFGANKKSDEAAPPPPKLAQVQYSPNV